MSAWTTGTVIDQADQTIMVPGDVLTFTASNGTWRYRLSGLNEDGQQAWLFVREDVDLL